MCVFPLALNVLNVVSFDSRWWRALQDSKKHRRGGKDAKSSKMDEVQKNIDSVTSSMRDNIGKVLDRGEKLDQLAEDTDRLNASSKDFRNNSRKLKRKLQCDDLKMKLLMVAGCLVVCLILGMMFCGGMSFPSCLGSGEEAADGGAGGTATVSGGSGSTSGGSGSPNNR